MNPQEPAIRVMVANGHGMVLWGLDRLIEDARPAMELVGSATSARSALEIVSTACPDVVVLDIDLEEGDEIIPALTATQTTRVLLYTGVRDRGRIEAAIRRGASGLVGAHEPPSTLLQAIAKVHGGELWLDHTTIARIFAQLSRARGTTRESSKSDLLTHREREIVTHIIAEPAADNRSLARKLRIGEQTLRNHLSNIYEKLQVSNRFQLYLYAQQHLDRTAQLTHYTHNGRAARSPLRA